MATISALTKLPAPSPPPPRLDSGTVVLYWDDNWSSRSLTLRTSDYAIGQRHTIPGPMFDNATFVSFNLPVGTVMTLMDNVTPVPGGHTVSDLSNCGRCVDLVGTGQTEGVN